MKQEQVVHEHYTDLSTDEVQLILSDGVSMIKDLSLIAMKEGPFFNLTVRRYLTDEEWAKEQIKREEFKRRLAAGDDQ